VKNWWDVTPEERQLEVELRQRVLDAIASGVWHTTSEERCRRILASGAILPEPPDLPQSERWGTPLGTPQCGYIRSLGGVSLFEFVDFDAETYSKRFPASSWATFVPMRREWGHAVWIHINREQLGQNFISAADVDARSRAEKNTRRYMPMIEAACIGSIPTTAFLRAFVVRSGSGNLTPFDLA
jgi:hypothetical protein